MLVVVLSLIFGPKLSYKLRLITSCKFRQTSDLYPYLVIAVLRKPLAPFLTRRVVLGV